MIIVNGVKQEYHCEECPTKKKKKKGCKHNFVGAEWIVFSVVCGVRVEICSKCQEKREQKYTSFSEEYRDENIRRTCDLCEGHHTDINSGSQGCIRSLKAQINDLRSELEDLKSSLRSL